MAGQGWEGFGAFFGAFFLLFLLFAIALLILFLLPTFQAYKAGRTGWWIYLIAVFIQPFGLVGLIAWFAYFKKNPTKLGDSGIVL